MYLTRNNFKDGKVGKNDNQIILLKLYKSNFVNNEWQNATELPFNSNQYSTAHPALSEDEKTLYFASDMPGTFGASDLYKVSINEDGSFGTPINLGASINTPGRETFPFVSDENEIYFASDGHPGLGGLDIFVAKISKDGIFKNIQNIGRPLNSEKDDFAFFMDSKTRIGYFTSNRSGGKGFDDIYKFTELRKLFCEQVLTGTVTDSDTNLPIIDAEVTLFDGDMAKIKTVITDANGSYNFGKVDCDLNFFVRANKTEYQTDELSFKTQKITGNSYFPMIIKKRRVKIEIGIDLANNKFLDIPSIHFDLDKFFIRQDAAFELEKVIALMKSYPTLKIDIRSHTDSRQTAKYNEILSENRAKSTMEWLIKNGISADRLTAKGFGESQLFNQCADGIKCSEKEHEANRRSEFIVISM
jgi:outer membrane protein OmpA-like peptidoglycan-associated protein